MTSRELAEERQRFLAYLQATFGHDVLELIDEPDGTRIGERVLYRLTGGHVGQRREPSTDETEGLRKRMTQLARDTGASGMAFEAARSSGAPYPRLVDLPGATIIWDAELRTYLESDEALPSRDFPLEWAVGVLRASEDLFVYLDFTHPKVKAVFTASYDPPGEGHAGAGGRIGDEFKRFRDQERDLERRADADSGIAWVKVVQIDRGPVAVRSRAEAPAS